MISNLENVKLMTVGDGAVGKTSLLMSYAQGRFPLCSTSLLCECKRQENLFMIHYRACRHVSHGLHADRFR
jgi:hypothetical protein